MKAAVTEVAPCKLAKGELRRVPLLRTQWPIGYHVACPRCGYVTLALNNHGGLRIEESVDGHVSFSEPIQCMFCCVRIHIHRCELTLKEGNDVRNAQYR